MDSNLDYLWKDIEYDTTDPIAGNAYPRTVFFLKWLRFYFHIIEIDNGEFYCGYLDYPEPHRAIYKCSKTFVEKVVLALFQYSIPVEIQKYSNNTSYRDSPHSAVTFWAIECHWNDLHLRFVDDADYFTYDFAVSALRIMKKLREWIDQEQDISPYKQKKSPFRALQDLLDRYFK